MRIALTELAPGGAEALVRRVLGDDVEPSLPTGLVATGVVFSAAGPDWFGVVNDTVAWPGAQPLLEDIDEVRIFDGAREWHCARDGVGWRGRLAVLVEGGGPGHGVVTRRMLLKGADNHPEPIPGTPPIGFWRLRTNGGEVHVVATLQPPGNPGPRHLIVHSIMEPDEDGVQRVLAEMFAEVV